jgi:hypothetical protein
LLKEDTGDLKTPQIIATELHQLTKAEVLIEETVAIKIKATEEAKITTKMIVTQARTIVDTSKHQVTLHKIAGNCKQRRQQ